jgi:hypothetical protein
MLINANLSAGDFLDRYSILQIKLSLGLEVADELMVYEAQLDRFGSRGMAVFLSIIKSINMQLWDLEDQKRNNLSRNSSEYNNVSELITLLNDLWYQTKKRIDSYFKSEITEKKSHKE